MAKEFYGGVLQTPVFGKVHSQNALGIAIDNCHMYVWEGVHQNILECNN